MLQFFLCLAGRHIDNKADKSGPRGRFFCKCSMWRQYSLSVFKFYNYVWNCWNLRNEGLFSGLEN